MVPPPTYTPCYQVPIMLRAGTTWGLGRRLCTLLSGANKTCVVRISLRDPEQEMYCMMGIAGT
jgi:hypothetical protein